MVSARQLLKTLKTSHSVPRVAVLGAGYWGQNLIRNFHDLQALAAICDCNPARFRNFRNKYQSCCFATSYREILSDPTLHAVAIATPAETHDVIVEEAILAGKDVFVEKPLSLSVEQANALVKLARDHNRILMVGHLLWYHPAVLKLKELVKKGKLGRIQYVCSNRLNLGRIRREENILWSFAPHDVSVVLGLLEEMPVSVECFGGNYLHQQTADVTLSFLTFPSGVKAHIFVSWLHPFKEQKLVVVGDKQMVVFDDVEPQNKLTLYPHSIHWKNQLPIVNKAKGTPLVIKQREPLSLECLHFLESIRTRKNPRTDGEEGLRVLTVLQQCQASLTAHTSSQRSTGFHSNQTYFVHQSAYIDDDVKVGEGTKIWHFSHILSGSRIGQNCTIGQNVMIGPNVSIGNGVKIQNNVSVYQGVTFEDHVFCGPSVVFTNVHNPRSEISRMHEVRLTLVCKGATLGANCTILCGITIGRYAFIAAGAVLTKDVPDYALVIGSPARIQGWMCVCGKKLMRHGANVNCLDCDKRYRYRNHQIELLSK